MLGWTPFAVSRSEGPALFLYNRFILALGPSGAGFQGQVLYFSGFVVKMKEALAER